MVYGFFAELYFSSSARRNSVLTDLQTRFAERPRWGLSNVAAWNDDDAGRVGIRAEARFTSRADLDSLVARLESFATGQRAPLAGSFYLTHDCSHDGAPTPCVATRRTY